MDNEAFQGKGPFMKQILLYMLICTNGKNYPNLAPTKIGKHEKFSSNTKQKWKINTVAASGRVYAP